ncbi:1413_t:CDS:2, partial [Acaulospora colombiana]
VAMSEGDWVIHCAAERRPDVAEKVYPVSVSPQIQLTLGYCTTTTVIRYGPVTKNSESAVNVLLDIVQDQTGKTYQMDHFATRYPTNTLDIAAFLPIPSIIHYSAGEPFTKYEMCLVFAQILGIPHDHIRPVSTAPQGTDTIAPEIQLTFN